MKLRWATGVASSVKVRDAGTARPAAWRPDARRAGQVAVLVAFVAAAAGARAQQGDERPVYRCPGNPTFYTNAYSPQEARDKGCRTIEGTPITVIQSPRTRAPASGASGSAASRPTDSRVDPGDQRRRDSDARRIIEAELRKEEERLAALRKEFNGGEPERQGDERNYQKYLDRVAEMKASIARSESYIADIKRELARLPPP